MNCHYCHWSNSAHDLNCPNAKGLTEREFSARKAAWALGYRAGRSGGKVVVGSTLLPLTWRLGEHVGISALEESENGYDSRFDE